MFVESMMVASSVLQAKSSTDQGNDAAYAGHLQNLEYQAAAKRVVAESQVEARNQRRKAELLASRALAVAAASGGGASDTTVTHIIGDIEGEGSYRAMVALYDGEAKAQEYRMKGAQAEWAGKQQKGAGRIGALTSLLSGGASIAGYEASLAK